MEFHKIIHRVFLFCMFGICALAVVSFAHSRVQASLSASTSSTTSQPTRSEPVLMTTAENPVGPTTTEIKTTETATKESAYIDVVNEAKIESADSTKATETAIVKEADVVSTANARMRTVDNSAETSDSDKSLDDVETMKILLLSETTANPNNETENQEGSDEGVDSSNTENTGGKKSEENSNDSKILTGQVFTQPTVVLASDLEKEKNPKLSGDLTENLSIGNVELIKKYDGQKSLLFSGKVEPNSSFNIFIFSKDPVVMTIKADENGEWSYEMTKDLADGQHEVYIAVTERDGRIVTKSEPFAFVKTAEAATAIPVSELDEYKSPMQRSTASYILIAITIISVCLAVALALIGILNHKHKPDETII
ncbi:MAG: hypothetical protein ACD_5C00205G0004 [uncultured bacterium]|nr:MAG: hypothetical protein ACD_5C00205G0004 [uncultured bacterium]